MTPVPPLYVSEDEIARIVLGKRAQQWPQIAQVEERNGLPRVDPLFGGRYWPAVKAYLDKRNGLIEHNVPAAADGGENWTNVTKRRARA